MDKTQSLLELDDEEEDEDDELELCERCFLDPYFGFLHNLCFPFFSNSPLPLHFLQTHFLQGFPFLPSLVPMHFSQWPGLTWGP